MKECGITQLGRWPGRAAVRAVATQYAGEMRALAAATGGGWKDPRFAATLEAWLPQLPSAPKVIVCLRSPEAYVRSVTRLYGLVDRDAIERRWANLHRRLLDVIRDYHLEALCIEYDRLMAQPVETVAELTRFVGHELDAMYIEPDVRHYDYDIPERYAALYDDVRALSPGGARAPGRVRKEDAAAYLERVAEIEERALAAKRSWVERAGLGDADTDAAIAACAGRAADAAAAYTAALSAAQADLGALRPPDALARYHELAQTWVDGERLTVELFQQVASGERPAAQAVEAWRRFASPAAEAAALRARATERDRAPTDGAPAAVGPQGRG
jgi:hypothetical protein